MSNLIVITFDNPDEAEKVRETLRSGQKHDLIKLDDSAIVVKDEDGQMKVEKSHLPETAYNPASPEDRWATGRCCRTCPLRPGRALHCRHRNYNS